jgi:alkyldihydroxyacetonephosphate synthase
MTIAREQLRWNGWGRLGEPLGLSSAQEAAFLAELGRRFGRPVERSAPPVELDAIRLPPPKLSREVADALRAACGDDGVRTGAFERISHAAGRSLPDLLRLRAGDIDAVPEAVVYPGDEGAVAAVLRVAAEAGLAVVPFGGGTSVVGGVAPRCAPEQVGALSLDTTRLDRLLRVDAASGTATAQAGIDGPALEAALSEHGLTLGHFPQSFEHSTLGGWIATRSVGQESDGYGGIDALLVCARMITPQGVLRTLEVPGAATGPDLNHVVLGSEGALGVIVEATLRVGRAPRVRDARGMLFRSFAEGLAAVREVARARIPIGMLRLSDGHETELARVQRRDPARRFDLPETALRLAASLGYGAGASLLLYGGQGSEAAEVRRALARARAIGRQHGGLPLGRAPGRSWRRERFRTPYLRDWLLDRGVAVETLETALPWSRLEAGHAQVLRSLRSALEAQAGAGLAMAHLSHTYPDGACLYFTVLYPLDPSQPLEQWMGVKRAASDAVVAAGGTISHHHGVGIDHVPWVTHEKGALGMRALRALKSALDPRGVMNPGKLL